MPPAIVVLAASIVFSAVLLCRALRPWRDVQAKRLQLLEEKAEARKAQRGWRNQFTDYSGSPEREEMKETERELQNMEDRLKDAREDLRDLK